MKEMILLLVGAALVNNVVLSQFLGLCPFLGVSKRIETAAGMGGAVVFVITIASGITAAIYNGILSSRHINLTYMRTIVFIVVIAALVQFIEMVLKKYIPSLYNALGVYLPLITTNCAVLGIAITNTEEGYGVLKSMWNGFGTALGFTIAIIIMAGIRERVEHNDVPEVFKGSPMVLVTAGLMAIAFSGFAGIL
jgi:electron transport complex protein RnfA